MDSELSKAILYAKQLIELQTLDQSLSVNPDEFSKFGRTYFTTNENINGYLEKVNLTEVKKALTVLASGDHLFNLINNNILDVDTFDLNYMAEYMALGLKRTMILKYSYTEYIEIMNKILSGKINTKQSMEIIADLIPYMEEKYKKFWQKILDFSLKFFKKHHTLFNIFDLLSTDTNFYANTFTEGSNDRLHKNNLFTISLENYNRLKSQLVRANITFKQANAVKLHKEFDSTYDIILLSNILSYFDLYWGRNWKYKKLHDYEEKLKKISNPDALIFLQYIFWYNGVNSILFDYSKIYGFDLTDEEILSFKTNFDEKQERYSAAILHRVKK